MRIFISHGYAKVKVKDKDHDEPDFLQRLETALGRRRPRKARLEVLVDRSRLQAGNNWSQVLHDCLDECDSAVLALSARALTRPWVLQEATILMHRQRRHAGFKLYPVLTLGLTTETVNANPDFKALELSGMQIFPPGTTPEAVAAKLHQDIDQQPAPGRNQLVRVGEAIAAQLAQVPLANLGQLDLLCAAFKAPLAFDAGADPQRRRGLALARAIVGGRLGAGGLPALLKRLRSECALPLDNLAAVREIAAPLWIGSDRAGQLHDHGARAAKGPPPLAAALYAECPAYSGSMLVQRMTLPELPAPGRKLLVTLPDGVTGSATDYAQFLREAWASGNCKLKPEMVDKLLCASPCHVLVPGVPGDDVLGELRAKYPGLVFLLGAGAAPAPDLPLPPGVEALAPIDTALELQQLSHYLEAGGAI